MSIAIQITPNASESKAIRDVFDRVAKTGRNMRPALMRIGLERKRDANRRIYTGPEEWGPRTKRLGKSINVRADQHSVEIGTNTIYAAMYQFGGVIVPKVGKFLAIPVLASLRRSQVWPRDLPRGSMVYKPNARITIGTHSWTGPALVRAEPTVAAAPLPGGGAKRKPKVGEVMFALVRRVKIKGRPFLVWDTAAQTFALNQAEAEYRRAMGLGGGR